MGSESRRTEVKYGQKGRCKIFLWRVLIRQKNSSLDEWERRGVIFSVGPPLQIVTTRGVLKGIWAGNLWENALKSITKTIMYVTV